jgi:hypothetical protein
MLFEDRLGYNLYRPVGMEWWDKKLWNIYDHPATAQQFLSLDQRYKPIDGSPQLNKVKDITDDYYTVLDPEYLYDQKAVTYEQFMNMDVDIVIASIPAHIKPYMELAKLKGAKFIFQVGNNWTQGILPDEPINIMASANVGFRDIDHGITYHQEFDLNLFDCEKKNENPENVITSMLNVPEQFPDYKLFLELESRMPEWKFNVHGGQGRDGPINGARAVAEKILNSKYIWQVKEGGDGYGHILFNSAACGVPMIVKKQYYQGKLGEQMIEDMESCIVIDGLTIDQIIEKIEYCSAPIKYEWMSARISRLFTMYVDFDLEAKKLQRFLNELV